MCDGEQRAESDHAKELLSLAVMRKCRGGNGGEESLSMNNTLEDV